MPPPPPHAHKPGPQPGEISRRYEITVEREFLDVRVPAASVTPGRCPVCGSDLCIPHLTTTPSPEQE